MTFENYFVTDSLCCPPRSSIFTGKYPHDTKVFGNKGANSGYHKFQEAGNARETFAVALQEAGYDAAMMGKTDLHEMNNVGVHVAGFVIPLREARPGLLQDIGTRA